jgi:methionine-rich copper-binding protein CopC
MMVSTGPAHGPVLAAITERRTMQIRLPVAVLSALAALSLTAPVAIAHVDVKSRSPSKGGSASTSIRSVSVTFDGPIRSGGIRVVGPGGRVVSSGNGGRDPRNITRAKVGLKGSKRAGSYRARYSIVAADGHRQRGSWTFRLR